MSSKSATDAHTCGTDISGAKTPDQPSKSATATGSATVLVNTKGKPKQLSEKGKDKKQGRTVEGSSQDHGSATSSPDKKARGGKGAKVTTSQKKHPTIPGQMKKGNQQQKGKGNGNRRSQSAPTKPKFVQKANGSLASNHKNRPGKTSQKHSPELSCNEIRQLIKKDPQEIVERLNQSITSVQKILNPKDDQHTCEDFTYDIVHALAKACDAPSSEQLNNILATLKNSVFLRDSVGRSLERAQSSGEMNKKLDRRLFESLIRLFSTYLRHLPGSFADVPIDQMQRVLEQLAFEGKADVLMKLASLKEERSDAIRIHRETTKPLKRRIASHGQPPNDFREIPVCPSVSEVTTSEKPFFRENVTKGRYDDVEHYLDVQFRLLREDFLSPLREGIAEVVRKVPRHQCQERIKLYNKVRVLGKEYTKRGIIYKVQFDVSPFTVTRWESSKRLIFGSFLCLSKNNFQTMVFATVANRDPRELKKGQFDIQFVEGQDIAGVEERQVEYVMAESRAYFESCRHVLLGLKEMDEDNLPFVKHLVECNPDVDPPHYLKREEDEEPVYYDLHSIMQPRVGRMVPILVPESWPSAREVCLNESQLEAFKSSLTKEFSIIQGPPGTGKTYVGAKVVQCLLQNREVWDPQWESPMLMVCYTNHALDQFLEKVLEFLQRGIVRVGGRSKSEQLKYFNLRLLLGRMTLRQRELENQLQKTAQVIRQEKNTLRSLGYGVRSFTDLEYFMDERHADQFLRGAQMINAANGDICEAFKLWLCNKETKHSHADGPILARRKATEQDATKSGRQTAWATTEYASGIEGEDDKSDRTRESLDPRQSGNHRESYQTPCDPSTTGCKESGSLLQSFDRKEYKNEQETVNQCKTWTGGESWKKGILNSSGQENNGESDEQFQEEQRPNANLETIAEEFALMDNLLEKRVHTDIERPTLNFADKNDCCGDSPQMGSDLTVSLHNTVQSFAQKDSKNEEEAVCESVPLTGVKSWEEGILNSSNQENKVADVKDEGDNEQEEQGPNTSLETIGIDFDSVLLQGQRYLAGEEDDFQPLEANTTENDEGRFSAPEYGPDDEEHDPTIGHNSKDDSLQKDDQCPQRNKNTPIAPALNENNEIIFQGTNTSQESDGQPLQTTFDSSTRGIVNDTTSGVFDSGSIWSGLVGNESKQTQDLQQQVKITVTAGDLRKVHTYMRNEESMPKEDVREVQDIWMMSARNRRRLYLFWLDNYREHCKREIQKEENAFKLHCTNVENIRSAEEEHVLRGATVIGMTTSGAARYHDVLRRIKPKIVVIEEAAEVLEAHIITSLTRDTQHVIMIGDHKQLRPKAIVYELAQRYNLAISLFERMVLNQMDCKVLSTQHRMRPEIAVLTKRIYENEIQDHETVCRFSHVRGLQENMFFLNHQYTETRVDGLQSYFNKHEAGFAVALCRYLLRQGYRREQITVLTMYTGQLLELQRLMPKNEFEGVRVSVVDNFQGEENDIILLSLVRSNNDEKIGFLAESNRICVALSRARQGFYCIGNFDLLSKKCKLWKEICDDMRGKNTMGDAMKLACNKHVKVLEVKAAKDFNQFPMGGCGVICDDRLDCGHACGKLCHPIDAKHRKHKCEKTCVVKCPKGHPCNKTCHYPNECLKCSFKMVKTLPECRHEQDTECGIDVSDIRCQQKCERRLPCEHDCKVPCGTPCETRLCNVKITQTLDCGHKRRVPCHKQTSICTDSCKEYLSCGHPCPLKCSEDCRNAKCKIKMETTLPCEHNKNVECQYKNNPGDCMERCTRLLECEHRCLGLCREDCAKFQCKVQTEEKLPCGHSQFVLCEDYPENVTCHAKCGKPCSRNHQCERRCHAGSECPPCTKRTSFKIPKCGHTTKTPCHVDSATLVCQKQCWRKRICGHKCQGKCGSPCPEHPCKVMVSKELSCKHKIRLPCNVDPNWYPCDEMVKKDLPCKHQIMARCHLQEADISCETLVPSILPCHHKGKIQCHDAVRGNKGVITTKYPCREMVEKPLLCGHTKKMRCCDSPETASCPEACPAKLECGHSCTGECSDCRIRGYHKTCMLLCGRKLICCHRCKAPCGVPCPPCDRICDRRCSHGKYRSRCSAPCEPCPFPCEWICPHYKCQNLCKEMCDRPACNRPCQKKLQCGHPCIGLCGEECPSLCRFCHASKLSAIYSTHQSQKIRFLQLMDCDHVIEVRQMDDWMHHPDNQVHLKQCPVCRTPIRWCFRYGNIIRQSLEDVQQVFKEAHNHAIEIKADIHQIKKETGKLPELTHFPQEVRHIVQPDHSRTSGRSRSIRPFHLAHLYSLKNHLQIIRKISTTFTVLKATDATCKELLGPSEQREAAQIVEGSTKALESIELSLANPTMDLGILSQRHNYVVKFELAIHLIDAWCNVVRQGRLLSPVTVATLEDQKKRLAVYVRGRPDAIDRTELLNAVNYVRKELEMTPLPTPQLTPLMNFAGFSSNSWFKCEKCRKRHVYASCKIVCDGRMTEEQECRRWLKELKVMGE